MEGPADKWTYETEYFRYDGCYPKAMHDCIAFCVFKEYYMDKKEIRRRKINKNAIFLHNRIKMALSLCVFKFYSAIALNASDRSSMISSICSVPMESLMVLGLIP